MFAKRFEPQVFGPISSPFKVLDKKFLDTSKLKLPKNLKVHPIFHVSFLKLVTCDASRPNQEYNSRPPLNLINNELKFEVKLVLKLKQIRG